MTPILRNALPAFARWLYSVSLALWLGGLLAIGAFVAPTAFWVVRNNSFFIGKPALQAQIAGGIVGGSLRPFGVLCDVCAVLLLVSAALLWPSLVRPARTWTVLGMAVTVILLCTSLYQGPGGACAPIVRLQRSPSFCSAHRCIKASVCFRQWMPPRPRATRHSLTPCITATRVFPPRSSSRFCLCWHCLRL
jgi:hypothetical protein